MKEPVQKILATNLAKLYPQVCETWQKEIASYLVKFVDEKYIEVEDSVILKAYGLANTEQKKLINKYFSLPKELDFSKFDSYSKVCKELGEEELKESDYKFIHKDQRKKSLAQGRIGQLERFFNGKFKKNWKNQSVYVYTPYFTVSGSGRLVFHYSYHWASDFGGSPGFYQFKEVSDFIGNNKEFRGFYQDLM